MRWRQLAPGRAADHTVGRPGAGGAAPEPRRLAATGPRASTWCWRRPRAGSIEAIWRTQGRLLPGQLRSGGRAVVFEGVVREPFLQETLHARTDGRRPDARAGAGTAVLFRDRGQSRDVPACCDSRHWAPARWRWPRACRPRPSSRWAYRRRASSSPPSRARRVREVVEFTHSDARPGTYKVKTADWQLARRRQGRLHRCAAAGQLPPLGRDRAARSDRHARPPVPLPLRGHAAAGTPHRRNAALRCMIEGQEPLAAAGAPMALAARIGVIVYVAVGDGRAGAGAGRQRGRHGRWPRSCRCCASATAATRMDVSPVS